MKSPPKGRDEHVARWQYIQYLSKQIITAGGWKLWQHHGQITGLNSLIGSEVEKMINTIRQQRGIMKGVSAMTPHRMVKNEKDQVENLVRNALYSKRGSVYVHVDGRRKEVLKRLGDYNVYVGPMWRRKVWLPLYRYRKNQHGKNSGYIKRYFIVDATEVRSTAPEIHLYRVQYYDFQSGKNLLGYVGQSKLGERMASSPKKTVREAINTGIQLASTSVSERLKIREES